MRTVAAGTVASRVVLFSNSPYSIGGMEFHVLQVAAGLRATGAEVDAICTDIPGLEPYRSALAGMGVQVHALPNRRGPAGLLRRLFDLTRILRARRGSVLHLHFSGHTGGDLLTIAGLVSGARMLRTEHMPPVGTTRLLQRLLLRARDRFTTVIYVSSESRDLHITKLGRDPARCAVVYNGVDTSRFVPGPDAAGIRAELGLDVHRPVIGTVARLEEERKGIHHFVDMAAIVAAADPRSTFVVVGDGRLRPQLEAQAQRLGLGERMVFTGVRDDIPDVLRAMDVFVMPSEVEAGPYTLLEAMATELACVATPVGVVPELIQPRVNGLLVPYGDSRGMAEAVLELTADRELAAGVGGRARATIEARMSVQTMVARLLDLYGLGVRAPAVAVASSSQAG